MRTVPRIIALHLGHLSIMSEQLSQQIISAHGRNSVCIASALHLLQIIEAFNLSFSDLKHCNRSVLDETAQHGLGICSIAKQMSVFGLNKLSFCVQSRKICLACSVDIFQSVFVADKFLWHIGFSQNACKLFPTNMCGYSRSFSQEIVDQIDKLSFSNNVLLQ